MEKELILSIVVPVYNGGSVLGQCLSGYAGQLSEDMELLLIDDGSADGSGEVCMQCKRDAEAQGRRVRYIRQENQGIAGARNRGLQEAAGKYICFFDQDDRADVGVYRELLERAETDAAELGICATSFGRPGEWLPYEIVPDKRYAGNEICELTDSLLLNGFDYPFLNKDIFFYGTIWKCVIDREWAIAEKITFKVFKNFEDDKFFLLEALQKANTVVCISRTGYCWNQNIASESHRRSYDRKFIKKCMAHERYVSGLPGLTGQDGKGRLYKCALCYTDLLECLDNLQNSKYNKSEWKKVKKWVALCRKQHFFDEVGHLKKNLVRKRITCISMRLLPFGAAVRTDQMVCLLIGVMKRSEWIRKLERERKHSQYKRKG